MAAVKSLCTRAILIEKGRLVANGDVDLVVNTHLKTDAEMANGGVIPEHATRMTSGDARFHSVRLTDLNGTEARQLFLGQPFRIAFEYDVLREIPDGILEVSVSTLDGTHVLLATSVDGGQSPRRLEPGRHGGAIRLETTLLPRQYTIDLGLHHLNGKTADYVRRTLHFTVEKVAHAGGDHYRWATVRGYVRPEASWELPEASID